MILCNNNVDLELISRENSEIRSSEIKIKTNTFEIKNKIEIIDCRSRDWSRDQDRSPDTQHWYTHILSAPLTIQIYLKSEITQNLFSSVDTTFQYPLTELSDTDVTTQRSMKVVNSSLNTSFQHSHKASHQPLTAKASQLRGYSK